MPTSPVRPVCHTTSTSLSFSDNSVIVFSAKRLGPSTTELYDSYFDCLFVALCTDCQRRPTALQSVVHHSHEEQHSGLYSAQAVRRYQGSEMFRRDYLHRRAAQQWPTSRNQPAVWAAGSPACAHRIRSHQKSVMAFHRLTAGRAAAVGAWLSCRRVWRRM